MKRLHTGLIVLDTIDIICISFSAGSVIAYLVKIYRKYKNKGFEVFAVCIDQNHDNWLKMIRFDELSFINIHAPDFPDSETANSYNLKVVPSTYLIDKEGNIMARDIYGTELEKWLDNKL
jgi:hypothetical protein